MMSRPTHALIDLSALQHNLNIVRQHAPNTKIMAVIKANAYGHGFLQTAQALRQAEGFALLELDKAIKLRQEGFKQTILLLEGFFSASEIPLFEQYQLTAVVHQSNQIEMLAQSTCQNLDVFVKINSGMNRLGFAPTEFPKAMQALNMNKGIKHITLMTHFSSAGDTAGDQQFNQQLDCFNNITTEYQLPCSLANSAAILRYPETHANWVRPGIMLYGASPLENKTSEELGLRPAMTVSSKIISIQHINRGDKVGYSGLYQADQPLRIGIVAFGYADGYPRHAPTGTPVLVNGQHSYIIGRISMDMLAVDITAINDASIDSPVILWGKGVPIDEVANKAETISYELFCGVSSRVTRSVKNK